MSTRTDWVDYAKAVGIILVVYGHVARGLFNAGIDMPETIYRTADSVVYSFHMPLFFFLSGLFFYQSFSKRSGIGLTLNKIDTIIYPYLIWSVLQGGTEALLSNYTNGNASLAEVFSLWEPRAQFWFLYALFLVFVTSSVIYSFLSEKHTGIIFILACILYVVGTMIPDIKLMSYISNNLVYFVFGIAFTKYDVEKYFSSYIALLMTMLAFLLSQYVFHSYLGSLYTEKGVYSLLLAFTSILFVISLSVATSKVPNRFLAQIGASSMAIYVMHILAGSGARVILSKILEVDSMAIHLVIGCIAGLLLPLLALKVIKILKIPYVFSAPLSNLLEFSYNKVLQRTSR